MPIKVLDASALAALLFGEPEASNVADRLGNSQLAAPALLPFEVASVCLKKLRQHPDQREALLSAYRMATHVDVAEVSVELDEALVLAEDAGLTIYDASYLWLARKLGAELVTLDRRLSRAANH